MPFQPLWIVTYEKSKSEPSRGFFDSSAIYNML
jgi:hypothetical protein